MFIAYGIACRGKSCFLPERRTEVFRNDVVVARFIKIQIIVSPSDIECVRLGFELFVVVC